MIRVTIDDREVKKLLRDLPAIAGRAAEIAIDKTAMAIKAAIKKELPKVFDRPNPYTRNSLQLILTKNHNMQATVWFKEPDRMTEHYLVPQVEGTIRKTKGFERALDDNKFIPAKDLKLDRYGNISVGLIKQILSVLGKAERSAGYQANVTTKSAKRNKKDRDFIELPAGSRGGQLPPGVYRRVIRGEALTPKQRRKTDFRTYQQGKRKAVVRATGLQPVMLIGRQRAKTHPRLDFYGIAQRIHKDNFRPVFLYYFNSLVGR